MAHPPILCSRRPPNPLYLTTPHPAPAAHAAPIHRFAQKVNRVARSYLDLDRCDEWVMKQSAIDSCKPIRSRGQYEDLRGGTCSIGGTPHTTMATTCNYESVSHQDHGDARFGHIAWLFKGAVTAAIAGIFFISSKQHAPGVSFRIQNGDLLFLNTQVLYHHTQLPPGMSPAGPRKLPDTPAVMGLALITKPAFVGFLQQCMANLRAWLWVFKAATKPT